jgi:uncharacterized protein with FMN-binding domain
VVKSHSKAPRGLVALGAAAVIAVYAAGFVRTRAAAARWIPDAPSLRRPAAPSVSGAIVAPAMTTSVPVASRPAPTRPRATPARTSVKQAAAPVSLAASTASPSSVLSALPSTPAPSESTLVTSLTSSASASDTGTTEIAAKAAQISDAASPVATKSPYRDGSYSGWGSSRHGDIEATVVITDGRIASATISRCLTRYSCSWIAHLPGQVVSRQSADVDFVSGATQSTDAFYYAVVDALSKAKGS